MSNTSSITEKDGIVLEMNRVFNASRERVFETWSNYEAMSHWFGPEGCVVAEGKVDFQVGGTYRLAVDTLENGQVAVGGSYTEIVPPEVIAFTWKWEHSEPSQEPMHVKIELAELGENQTELRLTQTNFPDRDTAENHTQGWGGTFDKLAPLVEAAE